MTYRINCTYIFFKASQPTGQAPGSRVYEMQGVTLKCTRHDCSVL